jgi:hypothetical protein
MERWAVKRAAFSLLRALQPVYIFDDVPAASTGRLRVLHVGNAFRGRSFIEGVYGHYPTPALKGRVLVGPWPERLAMREIDWDLQLVEINRLYAERWRRAGYFVIPEWVTFSRAVEREESRRYAGAGQTLRREIRAVEEAGLETALSRSRSDFDLYYERMYLPYVAKRFGDGTITKSRRRLLRDFQRGFLMIVRRNGNPIAGGIVRDDGERASFTSSGVLDGSDEHLHAHVSAALDLRLHEWAASRGRRTIDVGHTRPFPNDGVFRNKRRWLMSISPDPDGVMGMALSLRGDEARLQGVLARFPFIYLSARGLGVFCVHPAGRPLDFDEAEKVRRQEWTDGLAEQIVVCPGGLREDAQSRIQAEHGAAVRFCPDLSTARGLASGEPETWR